jgi:uncharacterized protein YcfJ
VELRKRVLRTVLLGLVAGGLCGAAVGLGLVPPLVGVAGAALAGGVVALRVAKARNAARAK